MASKTRLLANLITNTGDVKAVHLDNVPAAPPGVQVYATKENLPATGLTSGDQAYVTNTSRLYISNGSGWYNVALINATPSLTIDPTGAIELAKDGSTPTVITLTATDSDNAVDGLTFSVDSDGSFAGLGTISQDSSVFTITPFSEDSATTSSSTLTFKASDGISFGVDTRTISLTFKVTNSNYTALLLQADTAGTDNQVDASTNAYTITETGNVTSTASSPHHPGGYSVYLDGTSNSTIQIKGESAVTVGTSDFSLSFWYKGDLASNRVIASSVATASTTQLYWNASVRADGAVWLQTRSTANGGLQKWGKSAAGRVTANKWHHITLSRQSGWHYVAIDGVQDTSAYRDQATFNITSQELTVGLSNITGYASYGKGYIRDYNFCVGASEYDLSVGDGNVAYTVPDEPITPHANTKFLLSGLPYIVDASASPLTIDIIGSAVSKLRDGPYNYESYKKADHGGSVYFDGSGDWLTISNSSEQMVPEAGDFTVEFWFYTANASTRQDPWSSYTSSTGWAVSLSLSTAGDITPYYGNSTPNQTAGGQFEANVWNHFAMAKSGSTLKIFMNGKTIGTDANDTRDYSGTSDLYIGAAGNQTNPFTGWISDARFVKGTAVYTSDFTPPTQPLTAITNTQLLTCTNTNDIWDTGTGNLLTKANNVTASNTQRKFATSSAIYFDGTNDHLEITDMGISGDLTFEFWFYQDVAQSASYRWLFGTDIYGGSAPIGIYTNNTVVQVWLDGSGGADMSGAFTAQTWHHVAVARDSGTWTLYIDGTSQGTSTSYGSTNFAATVDWWIGERPNGSYDFTGYMQDVRITNGLARYTGNFTPPTAEFEG